MGMTTSAENTLMARPDAITSRRWPSRRRDTRSGCSISSKLNDASAVATRHAIATLVSVLRLNDRVRTMITIQCQR